MESSTMTGKQPKMAPSGSTQLVCPNCTHADVEIFYELMQVPVHSVVLLDSRQEALDFPKGDIRLGYCKRCGFVSNTAFDSSLQDYSFRYEATQGYSKTFNAFHQRLAQNLIERFGLVNKRIIEIGCGQGDFLSLLCELGDNQGIGFDPAYDPDRSQVTNPAQVSIIPDYYSEKYQHITGDFICCKMTLEHIHQTFNFLEIVRRSIQSNSDPVIFFQVPNGQYVFGDVAFWDIYYEHCSYFNTGSLAHLFKETGFVVLDQWTDYDDQYLMIAARVNPAAHSVEPVRVEQAAEISSSILKFQNSVQRNILEWQYKIQQLAADGKRIVLWGGGSKSVAFMTTLGITLAQVEYVVDINPNKAGTFIPGTGQQVLMPQQLLDHRPDTVIIMNPVYLDEIARSLLEMGLSPEILSVQSV